MLPRLIKSTQPSERDQRVVAAVASVCPQAQIVQFLADTPGQCEDFIAVLVDEGVVVGFELDRLDLLAPARDVTVSDVRTYARQARGIHAKELIKARAIAKEELKRRSD